MTTTLEPATRVRPRPLALLLAAVLAAGLLSVSAPAQAANWQTVITLHGGKVQMCKKWVSTGKYRIRVRLNNRNASHRHIAGASIRSSDGSVLASRRFSKAAGRISEVKTLTWRRGNWVGFGIAEPGTGGQGGSEPGVGWLNRC